MAFDDRPTTTDPFTEAFTSVTNALTGSPSVAELIGADNIVADLDIQPQIDYRQAGDLPALLIIPETSDGDNLWSSSSTSDFELSIVFRLMTGDERIGKYLYPMRWAINRALFSAGIVVGDNNAVRFTMSTFTIVNSPDETYNISERGWIADMTMRMNLCVGHDMVRE